MINIICKIGKRVDLIELNLNASTSPEEMGRMITAILLKDPLIVSSS